MGLSYWRYADSHTKKKFQDFGKWILDFCEDFLLQTDSEKLTNASREPPGFQVNNFNASGATSELKTT